MNVTKKTIYALCIGTFATAVGPFLGICSCGNQNPIEYYTVHFDVDGATQPINDIKIEKGKTVGRPEEPQKIGYTFVDWFQDDTKTIVFDFSKPIYSNTTIYAKFVEAVTEVTVHFDADGAIQPINDIKIEKGKTVGRPEEPYKIGCTFVDWFQDDTRTIVFDFSKPIYSNTTIYAKFVEIGTEVNQDQWNTAFDKIGDRTQAQQFYIEGSITSTIYKKTSTNDFEVDQQIVLSDLIFNQLRHYCYAEETYDGKTHHIDVIGERDFGFFFQGRKDKDDAEQTITYKVTDSTNVTELSEYIRTNGKNSFSKHTKIGGTYIYYPQGQNLISRVIFDENHLINSLQYYSYDETNPDAPIEITYDLNFKYGAKEITPPEHWDLIKWKALGHLNKTTLEWNIKLPQEIESGCVLVAQVTTEIAQIRKWIFTYGGILHPEYTGKDVILYAGDNYFTLGNGITYDKETGTLTIDDSVPFTPEETISLLVNTMPEDHQKLTVKMQQ